MLLLDLSSGRLLSHNTIAMNLSKSEESSPDQGLFTINLCEYLSMELLMILRAYKFISLHFVVFLCLDVFRSRDGSFST